MITTTSKATEAANILAEARQDNVQLSQLPEQLRPATLEDAYAIQDATIAVLGSVGGWKVGAKPDSDPRCAILPATAFRENGEAISWPSGGMAAEVEIGFVLRSSLPPRLTPYSSDEVDAAIGDAHLVVELIASRFVDRKSLSPLIALADLQSNAAVLCGAAVPDWRRLDLSKIQPTLAINSNAISQSPNNAGWEETLMMLTWLSNHAVARGQGLQAGQIVITGARLGPIQLSPGDSIHANAAGFDGISFAFSANQTKGR